LNRIDDLIVFHQLQMEHIVAISELLIGRLRDKIESVGYSIQISDEAKAKLSELGYSPEFGARPLRRVIENYIENPISLKIISHEINKGDVIKIELKDDKIIVNK